jgi:hypothetical protein
MFLECLKVKDIEEISFLNSNLCYQFVMQHPENIMLNPVYEPQLYLVAIFEKYGENEVRYISPFYFTSWKCFVDTPIVFPHRIHEYFYQDIKRSYCSLYSNVISKGIMITHIRTGDATCFKNEIYEHDKKNKKLDRQMFYQYICIRQTNKEQIFLHHFPNYRKLFTKYFCVYRQYVDSLHEVYTFTYVGKMVLPVIDKFKYHAHRIHNEIYLPSLKTNKPIKITKNVIHDYLNNMHPMQLYQFIM